MTRGLCCTQATKHIAAKLPLTQRSLHAHVTTSKVVWHLTFTPHVVVFLAQNSTVVHGTPLYCSPGAAVTTPRTGRQMKKVNHRWCRHIFGDGPGPNEGVDLQVLIKLPLVHKHVAMGTTHTRHSVRADDPPGRAACINGVGITGD